MLKIIEAMKQGLSSRKKRALTSSNIYTVVITLIKSINAEYLKSSSSTGILSTTLTTVTKVKETLASDYDDEKTSVKIAQ